MSSLGSVGGVPPPRIVVVPPAFTSVLVLPPKDNLAATRSSTKRTLEGEGEDRPAKRIRQSDAKADEPPLPSAVKPPSLEEVKQTLNGFAASFKAGMNRAKAMRQANQREAYEAAKAEMLQILEQSFSMAFQFFDFHKGSTGKSVKKFAIYLYEHEDRIWAAMLRAKLISALPFRRGPGDWSSFSGWFQANPNDYTPRKAGHCTPAEGIKGMRLGEAGILPTDEDFAPLLILASALKIKNDETVSQARRLDYRIDAEPYIFREVFNKLNESFADFPLQEDEWRRNLNAAMDDELYALKASLDKLLRPGGQQLPWPNAQWRAQAAETITATTTTTATTTATTAGASSSVATVTEVFPAADPPFAEDPFFAFLGSMPGLADSSAPAEAPAAAFDNAETDWPFPDQGQPGSDEADELDDAYR